MPERLPHNLAVRKLARPAHQRFAMGLRFELLALLGLALASLMMLASSANHHYTSDDVAQQNAVASLTVHSPRVVDLPQNTYVLKLPVYAAVQLLPLMPQQKLAVSTLFLSLVAFVLFYWAAYAFIRLYSPIGLGNVAPVLWLPSLGVALGSALINPNSRNLEVGLAFVALTIMARWYMGERLPSVPLMTARGAIFAVLLGLLFYDDPYFAYTLAGPMLIIFGGKWLLFGKDRRAAQLAGVMLAAFVFSEIWHWLFWVAGIHAGGGVASFATYSEVSHHVVLFTQGMLNIFDAYAFGHPLFSFQTLALELNFLILSMTLLAPLLLLHPSVRQDTWKVFIVLQPLFITGVFILSDKAVNAESARYLVLMPFYAALIIAVVIVGLVNLRVRKVLTTAVLLTAALNVVATINVYLDSGGNPNAENQAIARIASEHHLTKGYASYWNAGINQYFADSKVLFIQSGCSPATGVKVYRLLLNEQVLPRPAATSFYLFDPNATHCTESELARYFGQPQSTIDLPGQKRLFLYGYDIYKRMGSR